MRLKYSRTCNKREPPSFFPPKKKNKNAFVREKTKSRYTKRTLFNQSTNYITQRFSVVLVFFLLVFGANLERERNSE